MGNHDGVNYNKTITGGGVAEPSVPGIPKYEILAALKQINWTC